MATSDIELVCAGRLCVDLVAEQHGSDLAHVDSFRRYLGGSAANICFGAARLGVRTAMLARVGDDQNGEFLRLALTTAGVDDVMVRTDPTRLTPLVMLAARPSDDFPRLLHCHESADMATAETDIDESSITAALAVLITGSFLSNDTVRGTTMRVVELARAAHRRVVLDIDYQPALWGRAPFRGGNEMLVMAERVTERLHEVLPFCDLVAGTGDEIRIAGGDTDLGRALHRIRALTSATIVVNLGAQGCLVIDSAVPDDLGTHPVQPGFAAVVINTVGAGDGFIAGFLSAWLRDELLDTCARRGNAVGALVVSRPGGSAAMPSLAEVTMFLALVPTPLRPDAHQQLRQLHRRVATPTPPGDVHVLAIDHRWQMEEMADAAGADRAGLVRLKYLLFEAFERVASTQPDVGVLIDDTYGASLLERATGRGWWLARSLDVPRSRPVEFGSGPEVGLALRSWPADQIAKLMVYAHPDDPAPLADQQWDRLTQLTLAAVAAERSFLVEFQAPAGVAPPPRYMSRLLLAAYERGITPDWWKLPPIADPHEWANAAAIIAEHDPTCHGMLVLGQTAEPEVLAAALEAAAAEPKVRGFAIGRAIFGTPARSWLEGGTDDATLVGEVTARFLSTISTWRALR